MAILRKMHKPRGASSKTAASRAVRLPKIAVMPAVNIFPLLLMAVVPVLAYGIYLVTDAVLSERVARVAITGDLEHVNQESIVEDLSPLLSDGFVLLDLDAMRERLMEKPWVYGARVERRWPNEVVVIITEQSAIARWGKDGFLNHRGEAFFPNGDLPKVAVESLPLLNGPAESAPVLMSSFQELSELLRAQGLILRELSIDARNNWTAVLNNQVVIVLGNDQVMEKMRRFLRAYQLALVKDFDRVERIDMRYSNGLAVAWREPQAEENS